MIESVFHFDTKVFRTARDMFLHPGLITVLYNIGKRTEYVPPARLYIFISIVYFFVAGIAMNTDGGQGLKFNTTGRDAQGKKVKTIDFKHSFSQAEYEFISKASPAQVDSIALSKNLATGTLSRLAIRHAALSETDPKYNVHILEKILKAISFSLFLLMPLFALFLKLIYIRKNMLYVQHVIFSLHTHSMFFFILLVAQLFYIATGHSVLLWALAGGLIYLLASMQNVYANGWGTTFFRFCMLLVLYLIASAAALAVSILTGAMML